MRASSHGTWVSFVRDAVDAWRKREGWSQATVVQAIIDHHIAIGADVRTGLRFEPHTMDAFDRMRINSERVYRWLDETKDNNLLGAAFTESILAALPEDLRHECASAMLGRHACMTVHFAIQSAPRLDPCAMLRAVIKESGDAEAAMVDLVDGVTVDELVRAQHELSESINAQQLALDAIEIEMKERLARVGR